jgi:methyl-accepting chemotaxis protein
MNRLTKILAIATIVIGAAVAAIFFMGQFEQTKPYSDAAIGLFEQGKTYVSTNLPTVVAAGGSVTAIAGAAMSKISSAKQQVSNLTTAANTQINGLLAQKEDLSKTVGGLKGQLTEMTQRAAEAETKLQEGDSLIPSYEAEIERLKKSNQELMDKLAHTPVNLVEVVK